MRQTTRKQLVDEIIRVKEEMSQYDVGSDEYLTATKAMNQLSETIGKLSPFDKTVLISSCGGCAMFVIYMIFSETHITDTRGIQFIKGLFRR